MTISIERLNILQQTFKATAKASEALEAAALNDAATAISELLAVREAQSVPIFEIEVAGAHWLNCSPGLLTPSDDADFSDWPDGVNKLYTAPPAPVVPDGYKMVPIELLSTASMLIDLCRTHATLNCAGTFKQRVMSDCETTMNAIASLVAAPTPTK